MIDDYYNEQEQWERVKQWLRENGLWIILGILLGLGALAGWRWWEQRVETRHQSASADYGLMLDECLTCGREKAWLMADELGRE